MKRTFVLHPFFFAAYAVLFLLSHNVDQIAVTQVFRPLSVVLLLAAVLLLLFGFAARDWQQGALSASLLLILFFSYGHVHSLLEKRVPVLANHAFLGVIWLLLLLAGFLLKYKVNDINAWTRGLNLVSVALLIFPIYNK